MTARRPHLEMELVEFKIGDPRNVSNPDNKPLFINPKHVVAVRPDVSWPSLMSEIVTVEGSHHLVIGKCEDIASKLSVWR